MGGPEGPTIKKIQSRSRLKISIEIFNLDRKFQSQRLDFPTRIGPRWVARSKITFSLENFQSRSRSRIFVDLWALWGAEYFFSGPKRSLILVIIRSGNKGAFRLPGVRWDHFRCSVEPSFGHIRCRLNANCPLSNKQLRKHFSNHDGFSAMHCHDAKTLAILCWPLTFLSSQRYFWRLRAALQQSEVGPIKTGLSSELSH